MTLRDYIDANGSVNWTSPPSPNGVDWTETYIGLRPIPNSHPPSLKNPQRVKIPTSRDGWRKGDSRKAKDQARKDLVEVMKRTKRQIGKPTISIGVPYPMFPRMNQTLP